MKKIVLVLALLLLIVLPGFTYVKETPDSFSLDDLYNYQKEYKSEEIESCSSSSSKTYMDYRAITSPSSRQYVYIRKYMTVDENTGLLLDDEGFIGVALGSHYGIIGDRYYFTLDSGVVLPLIKVEEKADEDTYDGCAHYSDNSVIEFVISSEYAEMYFGRTENGYILSGNFNNYRLFNGNIAKVEKVLDEKLDNYVTYYRKDIDEYEEFDIFNYASGY